jgi:hypothetical protein
MKLELLNADSITIKFNGYHFAIYRLSAKVRYVIYCYLKHYINVERFAA